MQLIYWTNTRRIDSAYEQLRGTSRHSRTPTQKRAHFGYPQDYRILIWKLYSTDATPLSLLTMRLPTLLMGMGSVHKVTQETGGEVSDVASVGMLDAALTGVISRLRRGCALGACLTASKIPERCVSHDM
jgi:hypothetical protein